MIKKSYIIQHYIYEVTDLAYAFLNYFLVTCSMTSLTHSFLSRSTYSVSNAYYLLFWAINLICDCIFYLLHFGWIYTGIMGILILCVCNFLSCDMILRLRIFPIWREIVPLQFWFSKRILFSCSIFFPLEKCHLTDNRPEHYLMSDALHSKGSGC